MKTTFNVLTVCGSGTVSSTMVAEKLKEALAEKGYKITTTEVKPQQVESYAEMGSYDFIAYTTPVPENLSIPAINAVGFLTGFDEEGFLEEVLKVIEQINA
ncbi:PTS sugar transporter subunit IIB [Brevibacillus humidisoli]|uniref:PTS sugar transporter subunit IIB n=1 Tax=Brevibacillus humidisoli TaxID=2895522 RepID=UPI001E408F18|nr:PTS sugar transporter subunit IIB [Brevibacillus humidisoli]UFJ39866.1 PTS sugar transporter subunit IIB [Brevibacillus humidisoli]